MTQLDQADSSPRPRPWRGGALAVAGIVLIAAMASVWIFREKLFLVAFAKDSMWGMKVLLGIDSTLAVKELDEEALEPYAEPPGGWIYMSSSPSYLSPENALEAACRWKSAEVLELLLSRSELSDRNAADAIQMLLELESLEKLEHLDRHFKPRHWKARREWFGENWFEGAVLEYVQIRPGGSRSLP